MKIAFRACLAVCLVLIMGTVSSALTGCAGYRLGSMLPRDIATVHIPTFENNTIEPLLETVTTREAIREVQNDGSLQVVGRDRADTLLTVSLNQLILQPIDFDEGRRDEASEYRLIIKASMVLQRRVGGEVVAEHPDVRGWQDFEVAGDLTTAKNGALPGAARDLAHNLVEKMVETW